METINYDDFKKLDLRMGKILEVEVVEDADKLLRCQVDVGDKDEEGDVVPRQILSGIREYIEDPQSLVGRMFPYLVNLKPRTIRGHESQGMILAGKYEDTIMLFNPSEDVPPGTPIS